MSDDTYSKKNPLCGEYKPRKGDLVSFPDAPSVWNRETPYKLVYVDDESVSVTYINGTHHYNYDLTMEDARRLGMRKVN